MKKNIYFCFMISLLFALIPPQVFSATLESGWPVTVPGKVNTSAVIANLDADADLEIAYGVEDESSTNHGIYIFKKTGCGAELPPVCQAAEYRRLATTYRVRSSPAVADVNNDGIMDVIAADRAATGKVYVWTSTTGALHAGWPKTLPVGNIVTTSPIAVNLDDDPQLEIVVTTWGNKVFAWNHDGTQVITPPGSNPPGTFAVGMYPFQASAAVGDLNKDGKAEIVAIDSNNYLYAWKRDGTGFLNADGLLTGAGEKSGPNDKDSNTLDNPQSSVALADIDGGGKLEIVVATHNELTQKDRVYAFKSLDADGDGQADSVVGWPKDLDSVATSSVAIADIDRQEGHQGLEIVVATEGGFLYAWHDDGTALFGPIAIGNNSKVNASPIIADVDGDKDLEIVVAAYDGKLYAYHDTGALVANWPIDTQPTVTDPNLRLPISFTTPAIADFDNDGITEIVVGADTMNIYAWDLATTYNASCMDWPKFRNDLVNSGMYLRRSPCGDFNIDGVIDVLDVVLLINYAFRNDSAPYPLSSADFNADNVSDVLDVVLLIDYVFRNGSMVTCQGESGPSSSGSTSVGLSSAITLADGSKNVSLNGNLTIPALGFELNLTYNPSLVKFKGVYTTLRTQGLDLYFKDDLNGNAKIALLKQDGSSWIDSGQGSLLELQFTGNVSGVTLNRAVSADQEALSIPTTITQRTVPVSPTKKLPPKTDGKTAPTAVE